MKEACDLIRAGELVAFPTETVYGLGADALHPEASKKIYAAKGRPSDNPLIVHIADTEDLKRIAAKIPEKAGILAEAFWPGPMTMILEKNDLILLFLAVILDTECNRLQSRSKCFHLYTFACMLLL